MFGHARTKGYYVRQSPTCLDEQGFPRVDMER
jgi:hypothetical protein